MILELFWLYGICCFLWFWNCSDCMVFVVFYDFGTVLTVWYLLFSMILELFWLYVICCFLWFWNCSDCMVFVVFYDFGTVLTVWYVLFSMILELFCRSDTLSTSTRPIVWQTGKRFRQLWIPYSQNSSKIIENNKYPSQNSSKIIENNKYHTVRTELKS
jgi:hypothetical protein